MKYIKITKKTLINSVDGCSFKTYNNTKVIKNNNDIRIMKTSLFILKTHNNTI